MSSDAQTSETITMLRCPECGRGRRHTRSLEGATICRGCGEEFSAFKGRLQYVGATAPIQQLADGPVVYADLADVAPANRPLIRWLKVPESGRGDGRTWAGRMHARSVAYLDGDERRAVDLFIDENPEFVADCLSNRGGNPLQADWSSRLYDLLVEQYHWRQVGGDDDE